MRSLSRAPASASASGSAVGGVRWGELCEVQPAATSADATNSDRRLRVGGWCRTGSSLAAPGVLNTTGAGVVNAGGRRAPVVTLVTDVFSIPGHGRSTNLRTMAISRSVVRDLLGPVAARLGYDLEDVSVAAAGRRSIVRVVVDRDGGLDLDAVADVSRAVSEALDATDALGDTPYVLEVTSPGVDRPLSQPRHWRRNLGRLVVAGDVRGRIVAVDDDAVTLDLDDAGERRAIPYGELGDGRVQVEFSRHEEVEAP